MTFGSAPATTPRSLVVLPTYNERDNLAAIITLVLSQASDLDVLVVDDNSPDGTGAIADQVVHDTPGQRVHVLHRSGKRGLGAAYVEAFRWALEHSYEYVFEMDADFSHHPEDLLRLRHAVASGTGDVAIGSRWVGRDGAPNWSVLRTLISRGGSLYARAILAVPVADVTSGFKCFSRRVLEQLDLHSVRSNGYAFQVELNYRCDQLGFKIVEVPIVFVERRAGKSKMSAHIVFEAMLVVVGLRMRGWFSREPVAQDEAAASPIRASENRTRRGS
jgi:dolichol-phosphate mannosyltransferase